MSHQNTAPKLLLVMPLPPPHSGPETYTQMLLASPLRTRFQIAHLNTSSSANNIDRGRFNWRSNITSLKSLARMLCLLKAEQPKLAILFMPMNRFGFIKFASLVLPCTWLGISAISSSQGSHFNHFYDHESIWMKLLIRYTLSRLNATIVLADQLKCQFAPFLVPTKLWTVYPGLDAGMFDNVSENCRTRGLIVLYVGHLSKAKGALDLLQAIPSVISSYPDTLFRFAGNILNKERNITFIENPQDNEAAVKKLLNSEDISEAVELLGIITGEVKLRTFAESDIFVLPSYAEGLPWAVLEAMLAGKAVITTPVGALPEVFEHEKHLLFVEPGDVAGISKAITRLVRNVELRMNMGKAAREIVQTQFNLPKFANQIERVCEYVLEKEQM